MMTDMEYITLNNGVRMPLLGYGVFQVSPAECERCVSDAQVGLRFLVQQGIVAIPKSSKIERMRQNLDVFDFTLSCDDMKTLQGLNETDGGTVPFTSKEFTRSITSFRV